MLHWAARVGHINLVKLLTQQPQFKCRRGGEKREKEGGACGTGALGVVNEVGINSQDVDGRTALHYAIEGVDAVQIIQCLLDAGADPMREDRIKQSE